MGYKPLHLAVDRLVLVEPGSPRKKHHDPGRRNDKDPPLHPSLGFLEVCNNHAREVFPRGFDLLRHFYTSPISRGGWIRTNV